MNRFKMTLVNICLKILMYHPVRPNEFYRIAPYLHDDEKVTLLKGGTARAVIAGLLLSAGAYCGMRLMTTFLDGQDAIFLFTGSFMFEVVLLGVVGFCALFGFALTVRNLNGWYAGIRGRAEQRRLESVGTNGDSNQL